MSPLNTFSFLSKKWQVWLWMNGSLILSWVAMVFYYGYHLERGDYPTNADTIMIPIYQETVLTAVVAILMNVFCALCLSKARLLHPLFFIPKPTDLFLLSADVFFALLFLFQGLSLFGFIQSGDFFAIPATITMVIGLLHCRSSFFSQPSLKLSSLQLTKVKEETDNPIPTWIDTLLQNMLNSFSGKYES